MKGKPKDTRREYEFPGVERLHHTLRLLADKIEADFPPGVGFGPLHIEFRPDEYPVVTEDQGGTTYVSFSVFELPWPGRAV